VIGWKWKGLILWALRSEAHRFAELRRVVEGISEKMLIQNLKEMEADGIVKRKDFREVPPRVEYAMTPFGQSLYESPPAASNNGAGRTRSANDEIIG
jgi:DNA-binding HxlR family transcriptional regulator